VRWLLDLLELEDCTAVRDSWKEMVESQHESVKEVAGSSAKHVLTVASERGTLSLANVSKEQYIFLFPMWQSCQTEREALGSLVL